jgi:hypothetical protein
VFPSSACCKSVKIIVGTLFCGGGSGGIQMSQEMIAIVSPVGQSASKKTGLAPRNHNSLQGLRIGLLDNNKPNADKFLEFVGEMLKSRNDAIELIPKRKMSRTEADCLPELIARCDVVINAFAD